MLSSTDKDEVILLLQSKVHHLRAQLEEAITLSEGAVASLEDAQKESEREQGERELVLWEELQGWKLRHPQ
ncbi:unnamed protein product, partial [Discosporangium mesarthrocarpum]